MTIRECYETVGGDYAEVMGRLRTEERVLRFLKMVADDPSFSQLTEAVEAGNAEEAFRAAHTLKGVCMNLSLTRLAASSRVLTEALRDKKVLDDNIVALFNAVRADYVQTKSAIQTCLAACAP